MNVIAAWSGCRGASKLGRPLFSPHPDHFVRWPEVSQRSNSPRLLSPEIRGLKNLFPSKWSDCGIRTKLQVLCFFALGKAAHKRSDGWIGKNETGQVPPVTV